MFLNIFLVLGFALIANSFFKLQNKPAFFVSIYLLANANIIVVTQLAGLFYLLSAGTVTLLQFFFTIAAWGYWMVSGRPSLFYPFKFTWRVSWHRHVLRSFKKMPDIWLIGIAVGLVYLLGAVLILVVRPNTYDGLTYHISRAGYWLQNKSFAPWPTPNLRQVIFPMNAEIGLLWTMLFWGSDRLVGFVEWLAVPITCINIYGLGRLLGGNRQAALFSSLIWATFPQVVFQATSTFNDLIVNVFFISMVYLLFLGMKTRETAPAILSGISMGLAFGTKSTVLLLLPGLACVLLYFYFVNSKPVRWVLVKWIKSSVLAAFLLGAYVYIQNLVVFQHIFGSHHLFETLSTTSVTRWEMLKVNLARYFYQLIDFSPLPDIIANPLNAIKINILSPIFSWIQVSISDSSSIIEGHIFPALSPAVVVEARAWFGPLIVLVWMPALVNQVVGFFKEKDNYRIGLIALIAFFLLTLSAIQPWDPFKGRFFLLAITLGMPLTIGFGKPGIFRWGAGILAVYVMTMSALFNPLKPVLGPAALWNRDFDGGYFDAWPNNDSMIQAVNALVPPDAVLATILGIDDVESPLFGEHYTRFLIPLFPYPEKIDTQILLSSGIEYVLVKEGVVPLLQLHPSLYLIAGESRWSLYYYNQEKDFFSTPIGRKLLCNHTSPHNKPFLMVDSELVCQVGLGVDLYIPRSVQGQNDQYFTWLGQGSGQSLQGVLWSSHDQDVELHFSVEINPAGLGSFLDVEFKLEDAAGLITSNNRVFDHPSVLVFSVKLKSGRNVFSFSVVGQQNESLLPKGLPTQNLVRVNQVIIYPVSTQ
ncbi:MAG: glycosyltransferase family 39 protein [Anaerolineae bacterium]|nr:glycosyltransferase family 39 protein [Anaerolineae bacterium]